jgi:hypothetical protein
VTPATLWRITIHYIESVEYAKHLVFNQKVALLSFSLLPSAGGDDAIEGKFERANIKNHFAQWREQVCRNPAGIDGDGSYPG